MSLAAKLDGSHTYADYLRWSDDQRWELIDGRAYCMTPAPRPRHQRILVEFVRQVATALRERRCEVFAAPFDVRLADGSTADEAVTTVVQPDLVVVCDPAKIDDRGCAGAPDLVVEILSETTAGRDETVKLRLYQEHGVREYWVVNPADRTVRVYALDEAGSYGFPTLHTAEEDLASSAVQGLSVDLREVFSTRSGIA